MKVGDKVSIKDLKSDLFNKQAEIIGFEEQDKAIVMVEHYVFRNHVKRTNCIIDRFEMDKLQEIHKKRKAS